MERDVIFGSTSWLQTLPAEAIHYNSATNPEDRSPRPRKARLSAKLVHPGSFEAESHFYPRCLVAQIHPLVASFFSLGNVYIIERYTHLNPSIDASALTTIMNTNTKYFKWAGSDLFNVTTAVGHREMIVVETNSCPSGQKSMPNLTDSGEQGGYRVVIENCFADMLKDVDPSLGGLAFIYDKNPMEATGYAAVIADVQQEDVWLAEFYENDKDPPVKWQDKVLHVRDKVGDWHPMRACFRYVTKKPWNRLPISSKTLVLNSTVACLSGGRNKMMASRAYDLYNSEIAGSGLRIRTPETIRNVTLGEVPLWVDTMGGHAVVKVPYSHAGQGVYTIMNQRDLDDFMKTHHSYDRFIVQSLVGSASWNSVTRSGRYYHVGTISNKKCHSFVYDLRVMVCVSASGFQPVAIYGRRARKPLVQELDDDSEVTSWEMLGTNLSVKVEDLSNGNGGDHASSTETQRLLLMDREDFDQLGIGIDDLIDAYVQTVLSVVAIDKMCQNLMKTTENGGKPEFDSELFAALNPDEALISEMWP